MLILYSNAQENLPFDKKHSDDLFVAPYISSETVKKVKKKKKKSKAYDSDDSESSSSEDDDRPNIQLSEKDCCFFNLMDNDDDVEISSDEISYSRDADTRGFEWCPRFFNAGASNYVSKLHVYFEKNKKIIVRKFQSESYY